MKEFRYRLLLLGAFVVGLYLAVSDWHCPEAYASLVFPCKLLPEIPRKIGDALILAPLLALIVDEAAKRRLIEEFSLDVSSHIIGRLLPPELRKHLHGYLQMFIVRTRWDIIYTIEKWDGQPGYIKLETITEYDMDNRSEDPQDHEFIYSVEDSLYPCIGATQIIRVRLVEDTYDNEALKAIIKEENGYKTFSSKKRLQPHSAPKNPSYFFRAESVECFRDSGFSPFTAIPPVLRATLSVWYPKKDFRLSLELTYDRDKSATKKEEISDGERQGTKWIMKGPILPGQGFIVRWDIISPPVTALGQQPTQ